MMSPGTMVLLGAGLLMAARRGGSVVLGGNRWPLRARVITWDASGRAVRPGYLVIQPVGIPVQIRTTLSRDRTTVAQTPAVLSAGSRPEGWRGSWPPPRAHVIAWVSHWLGRREVTL